MTNQNIFELSTQFLAARARQDHYMVALIADVLDNGWSLASILNEVDDEMAVIRAMQIREAERMN